VIAENQGKLRVYYKMFPLVTKHPRLVRVRPGGVRGARPRASSTRCTT
jgi:hypothetical protein